MRLTFHPKYSFSVLPSNILGVKWIENLVDLFALLPATLRVQCFVSILTGNSQSGSRDRKNLIGCYWKQYDNRSFYQISCITIIVIFFRRINCFCLHFTSLILSKTKENAKKTSKPDNENQFYQIFGNRGFERWNSAERTTSNLNTYMLLSQKSAISKISKRLQP